MHSGMKSWQSRKPSHNQSRKKKAMARSKEPTIADLFEELEIIIEEFENNYEQTLKELKKKLKER